MLVGLEGTRISLKGGARSQCFEHFVLGQSPGLRFAGRTPWKVMRIQGTHTCLGWLGEYSIGTCVVGKEGKGKGFAWSESGAIRQHHPTAQTRLSPHFE